MMQQNRSPSIVFVQPAFPHYRQAFFRELADTLGDRLRLFYTIGDGVSPDAEGKYAIPIGALRSLYFGLNWQQGAMDISFRPGDLFVMSGSPRTLSNLALAAKARAQGAKIIWWGHYWSSTSKRWRFALRLKMMGLADALLFYTDQEIDEFKARNDAVDDRPVGALNNGIDMNPVIAFRNLPYRVSERPRDLLFIGRITEKCELRLVIEALAKPTCQSVTLDVIGEGDASAELMRLACDLGVDGRIVWHGANTDEGSIANVMNRCKAFVYPGAVGLSLIHALAYGLPVIVHGERWKHMPEIAALEPGQNGNVFTRGDADSLSHVIASTLASETALEDMSERAVKSVEGRFTTKAMSERFLELVKTIESTG